MYLKFRVSRETANDFMHLFVNRLAYGMQATKPLPNGSVPYYLARDWLTKAPKLLDADVVRMHLNGDITINLFAINPETQRSKWIAIDADFDGAMQSLIELQQELKHDGVEAALEQSRRGGHLWIFGETPLLAAECRIYIYNLALRLGFQSNAAASKTASRFSRVRIVLKTASTATRSARRLACIARRISGTGSLQPHHDQKRSLPISMGCQSSLRTGSRRLFME